MIFLRHKYFGSWICRLPSLPTRRWPIKKNQENLFVLGMSSGIIWHVVRAVLCVCLFYCLWKSDVSCRYPPHVKRMNYSINPKPVSSCLVTHTQGWHTKGRKTIETFGLMPISIRPPTILWHTELVSRVSQFCLKVGQLYTSRCFLFMPTM